MSSEQFFLVAFFLTLASLFLSAKVSVDLVALVGVLVLVFAGFLSAEEALLGFSSPAVVTMVATFVLGTSLSKTGVISMLARRSSRVVGKSERKNLLVVLLVSGLISSVMNNVAAVALLLPLVISLAERASMSPARLLIPLAFGAVLGGTTTLIGNPANILAAEYLYRKGEGEVQFFDFFSIGFPFFLAGSLAILLFGPRLLPLGRKPLRNVDSDEETGLLKEYQSREKLITFQVPPAAKIVGKTLAEIDIGGILDAQITVILRGARSIVAPQASEIIKPKDVLITRVHPENVERILALPKLQFSRPRRAVREAWSSKLLVKSFECGLEFAGETLRSLQLRTQYGLHCVAIQKNEQHLQFYRLSSEKLSAGDRIVLVGKSEEQFLGLSAALELQEVPLSQEETLFLGENLCVVEGKKQMCPSFALQDLAFGELFGLQAFAYQEGDDVLFLDAEHQSVSSEQLIYVFMERSLRRKLEGMSELGIELSDDKEKNESEESTIFETVIAPRSELVGKTPAEIQFRQRYDLQIVAIWRAGKPVGNRISTSKLTFGDALLLQGSEEAKMRLYADNNFLILKEGSLLRYRRNRQGVSILGFLVMIILSALQLQPVHVAALTGALLTVVGGAVRLDEAYREIEWKIVMLMAGLIPLGMVVERSGLVTVAADFVLLSFGETGVLGFFVLCVVLASIVSQMLDNSVAFIMLAPLIAELAPKFGVSVTEGIIFLAVSSSLGFLTQFSHKSYLLVMSAGGYKTRDYLKLGSVVTIATFLAIIASAMLFR